MYDSSDSFEGNWLSRATVSKQNNAGCANERSRMTTCLVLVATLVDVFIVLGIATIEYFFRWVAILPLRNKPFQYSEINFTTKTNFESSEFEDILFGSKIPELAVYIYSFSVPIIIVIIGELILFCMANQTAKLLPGGSCSPLHIPHTIRRLYRFSLSYLFGILCLMVIVDLMKISIREVRPNFLSLCLPISLNSNNNNINNNNNISYYTSSTTDGDRTYRSSNYVHCTQRDTNLIRKMRTSCPSMRSAISMYAAVFVTIYLHGIGRIHHCKYLLIPFINMGLILMSLLCGINLVRLGENWWIDIIIGFILGAFIAFYLTTVVLRQFQFQESVSNRRILRQIALLQSGNRSKEAKEREIKSDCLLEPVRLRRANGQQTYCPCHTTTSPPPTGIFKLNSDETSTFFPFNKPNRKSVTLPINSPHIPISHKQLNTDKTVTTENGRSNNISNNNNNNRLSAFNLPYKENKNQQRNSMMNQNFPKISQELINMLNAKQDSNKPEREIIDLSHNKNNENPVFQFV